MTPRQGLVSKFFKPAFATRSNRVASLAALVLMAFCVAYFVRVYRAPDWEVVRNAYINQDMKEALNGPIADIASAALAADRPSLSKSVDRLNALAVENPALRQNRQISESSTEAGMAVLHLHSVISARRYFVHAVIENPANAMAWYLLGATEPDDDQGTGELAFAEFLEQGRLDAPLRDLFPQLRRETGDIGAEVAQVIGAARLDVRKARARQLAQKLREGQPAP